MTVEDVLTQHQEQEREAAERLARAVAAAKAAIAGWDGDGPDDDGWERVVLAVRGADLQAGEATRDGQGRPSAGRGASPMDYRETFHEFWQRIVGPLDALDADKVARELHDYSHLMAEVLTVYCHITGDRMSYPSYYASDVCREADAYYDRIAQEHGRERTAEALREVIDRWQVFAEGDISTTRILEDIGKRIEALEQA